jgi:hypothetical protein
MSEKPSDGNFLQISRDIDELKKLKGQTGPGAPLTPAEEEMMAGRFEILPSTAISEDERKHAHSKKKKGDSDDGGESSSAGNVTGSNYTEVYLEQQRKLREQLDEKKAEDTGAALQKEREEAAKKAMEKKVADDYRFRAREIQNQIVWWQQQAGLGQYDETVIGTTIDTLRNELAGIPQAYW